MCVIEGEFARWIAMNRKEPREKAIERRWKESDRLESSGDEKER